MPVEQEVAAQPTNVDGHVVPQQTSPRQRVELQSLDTVQALPAAPEPPVVVPPVVPPPVLVWPPLVEPVLVWPPVLELLVVPVVPLPVVPLVPVEELEVVPVLPPLVSTWQRPSLPQCWPLGQTPSGQAYGWAEVAGRLQSQPARERRKRPNSAAPSFTM